MSRGLLALANIAALAMPQIGLSAEAPQRRVVVVPLQALGAKGGVVKSLDEVLRAEVSKLDGVELRPPEQSVAAFARAEAEAAEQGSEGCKSDACLASTGQLAQAEWVMFGTVASLGESHVLDLKLVEVESGAEARRLSTKLAGEREVMIEGIRVAVTELLAPEQFVGSLEVLLDAPGAEVFVDGHSVGQIPLPPVTGLSPGEHAVKIVLKGYRDFDRFVTIRLGRTSTLKAVLSEDAIVAEAGAEQRAGLARARSRAKLLRTVAWSALGAGAAVAAVGGGGLYLLGLVRAEEVRNATEAYNAETPRLPERHAELEAMRQEVALIDVATLSATGVGGILLATGAVLFFVGGDPDDYGEAGSPP